MTKQKISTTLAPLPIGTYSQGIKINNIVYLSGQIPVNPHSGEVITLDKQSQIEQIFKNLLVVAEEANGTLDKIVKLTIFMTDLSYLPLVNAIMRKYFSEPYPARSAIGVSQLPGGCAIEIEGIMVLDE